MDATPRQRAIAVFADADVAHRLVTTLRSMGVPPDAVRVDDPDDEAIVGREAQRREAATAVAGPGVVGERRTMRAGWFHTFAWGAVGTGLGALIGLLVPLGDMSELAEVVTLAVVGALALGTAGFVFGLGRGPDRLPAPRPQTRHTILSVVDPTPQVVEVLRTAGPEHLQHVQGDAVRATHDQRVGRRT